MNAGVITTTITIEDMHCAACSSKVRSALGELPGIGTLRFNPVRRQVLVDHPPALSSAALIRQIERAGFHPAITSAGTDTSPEVQVLLRRLGVSALGMMQVMMVSIALYAGQFDGMSEAWRRVLEYSALIFTIPVLTYSAVPFFVSALDRRRGMSMDTPIALAIGIAFSVSFVHTLKGSGEVYFDAVTMFTFLMLLSRYLDRRMQNRLRFEDSLLASLPATVTLLVNDTQVTCPLADVRPGDRLWVPEGAMLPVDGILVSASATLEEASLTGEADWREASMGDAVHAGTFTRGGAIIIDALSGSADSRYARIDSLANAALSGKHRLSVLADRAAGIFVPTILAIAALAGVFWLVFDPTRALTATLAVLVVSCPCALALATPTALHAALVRLRRAGILVRDGGCLERAAGIRHVRFDKTGTLTDPEPTIIAFQNMGSLPDTWLQGAAAALQQYSSHPLARAFSGLSPLVADTVEVVAGQGVRGRVEGHDVRIGSPAFCNHRSDNAANEAKVVCLTVDGNPAARFHLDSRVRPDASATVQSLRAQDIDVAMLSGDNAEQCARVAGLLDIEWLAAQSPEAKIRAFADPESTLYVGDGINDLPALTHAGVSAATLETTDLVKSRSDVVLLTSRLSALLDLLAISRASRRVMWQNLYWAAGYNLVAIPLAFTGLAPPWAAAVGMSVSSLIVLLNATRLLRVPLPSLQLGRAR
ncbi:MAG: cation-translocating P-type ATPase [Pseudomonadales bacterium]